MRRIYVSVPFAEKDEARRHGARWDQEARGWYIPEGAALAPFQHWTRRTNSLSLAIPADPRQEFAEALRPAGRLLEGPDMDGRLRRVRVEGDRRGAKSGAYVGFLNGYPAGYIENLKTGLQQDWKASAGAPC